MSVESIKTYTVSLSAAQTSNSVTMDGQATANCIPIITNRVTTPNGAEFAEYRVKATFDAGDLVITRGEAVTAALTCVVSVWEFDGVGVVVDTGTFEMLDLGSEVIDVVTVEEGTAGLTDTFLVSQFSGTGIGVFFDRSSVRGRITATDTLTFDRENGNGDISGVWYTARATAGFFTVQQAEIAIATGATATVALDSAGVSPSKTFLVGSHAQGSGDDNADSTYDITLTQTTNPGDTVTLTRATSSASLGWWGGSVVTLTGSETVYHGTIDPTDGDDIVTITGSPTVSDNSVVFTCGCSGGQSHGAFTGSDAADVPASQVTWEIVTANTQVQCLHYTGDVGAVTYNVVDFDLGAPPATRRIMVIS